MSVAAKSGSAGIAVRPQILVVDDEPALVELLADVARSMDCRVLTAASVSEARRTIARESVQLLVADVKLPDGDGLSLLPTLRKKNPAASAIVITGDATVASATAAIRSGAVDFIAKPFDARQIVSHVRSALAVHEQAARAERKLKKLKSAVRKLNDARKTISQKVDILCNDLVSAYGELSKQFDTVRVQEAFRKTIEPARDLEQLICQSMDWLMRQVGYSNVAVWLVGEDGSHQLGAYMKYTIPGDDAAAEAIRRVILPLASRDGRDAPVRLDPEDVMGKFTPAEQQLFQDQQFLALDCTYLGEDLAALVFFRDGQVPFSDQDVETLRSVGPIFAQSLAAIVRGSADDADHEPTSAEDDDYSDHNDGPPKKPRKSNRPDPADWWKRGESPPF